MWLSTATVSVQVESQTWVFPLVWQLQTLPHTCWKTHSLLQVCAWPVQEAKEWSPPGCCSATPGMLQIPLVRPDYSNLPGVG